MMFERIIFMRESLDLSQREMADKIGTSKSNYARWETGEKVIPLTYLIKLCNMTQTPLDFALSISSKRTDFHKLINDPAKIGSRLKDIRKKHNLNQITKTLEKLFDAGFNTDKKILALKLEDLEKISNLQSNEALIIIEFKKAIKNKNIIAFLSGQIEEK